MSFVNRNMRGFSDRVQCLEDWGWQVIFGGLGLFLKKIQINQNEGLGNILFEEKFKRSGDVQIREGIQGRGDYF